MSRKSHKVPENGTTSENSQVPEKIFHTSKFYKVREIARAPIPSLPISLWALPLSEFFSLCGLPLSELYLSVFRDLHCFPKTIKNNGFSMFLRFQAFLESFKSQDGPTKNIKTYVSYIFWGFQVCLETCIGVPVKHHRLRTVSFANQSLASRVRGSRNKSLDV